MIMPHPRRKVKVWADVILKPNRTLPFWWEVESLLLPILEHPQSQAGYLD
jgi:hypothetical protein